jgi:hypothetical protein
MALPFWRSVPFAELIVRVTRVVCSGTLQAVGAELLLATYVEFER